MCLKIAVVTLPETNKNNRPWNRWKMQVIFLGSNPAIVFRFHVSLIGISNFHFFQNWDPEMSHVDTKPMATFQKESHLPKHHFGYLAVSFRGCMFCLGSGKTAVIFDRLPNKKHTCWVEVGSEYPIIYDVFSTIPGGWPQDFWLPSTVITLRHIRSRHCEGMVCHKDSHA